MNAKYIEQAIKLMELDKRCWLRPGNCSKCDSLLYRKLFLTKKAQRDFIVDTICSCRIEDFKSNERLRWLVTLLNNSEYERIISRISQLAPFDRSTAWIIIHLSANKDWNLRLTFNKHGQSELFKRVPQLHLHPSIAPSLISACIHTGTENEDANEILNYFESIAHHYPALQAALPQWQLEQVYREDQCRAEALRKKDQNRIEMERLKFERAGRLAKKIEHQLKSKTNSVIRNAWITQLEHSTLTERLYAACDSKWALTYFPESWGEKILSEPALVSAELRMRLLSKLMRLQRRSQWRTVRQKLLRGNHRLIDSA